MNILKALSIKSLKLNKKRTISTIMGIILSTSLICAVAGMFTSFRETLVQNAINESGYYHLKLSNITNSDITTLENNRDIKTLDKVIECGYSKLEESKNKDKPYLQLYSMSNETFNNLSFNLIEGKFPTNSNEIIISKHIKTNAKVDLNVGDTIKLNIGERNSLDNYELNPSDIYDKENEQIINPIEYTFKIVGIIERPNYSFEKFADPGYTIITTGMNKGKNNIYVSLKNPIDYKTSIPEILGVNNLAEIEKDGNNIKYDYTLNNELLRWEVFKFSDSTVSMLYSIVLVVIVIIIFTSVFCIRNSFAIAITEKTRMYSMLASVGATKKQIKKSVITEGLILSIIGIPLGIISGYFAVFILIKIVNAILGDYLLANVDGIIFKISIIPIILSIILGLITIYLSAISSARRASRISPIEGLKNSKDIKITNKKLKVPKIISKIFKTGGSLAYKNLKRSKKKYKTTVISIAVSIFVFITMNSFIANMFEVSGNYYKTKDYNIQVTGKLSEENIDKVLSLNNIESYSTLYNSLQPIRIMDLSKINDIEKIYGGELPEDGYYDEEKQEFIGNGEKYCNLNIIALDNTSFKKYIDKLGMKYDDVKSSGILCDQHKYYDADSKKTKTVRWYNYSKGDTIEGELRSSNENNKIHIKVAEVSDIVPSGMENIYYNGGYIVVNKDEYKNMSFVLEAIVIQSNNTEVLYSEIKNIDSYISVYNMEEAAKKDNAMVLVVKIFLYGFITVITLIGVTNIFNTITSNMELRQKEFAVLKAVGMTKKEFNRMINLETIFYGTKALIYGIILGMIGTFAMYKAFDVSIDTSMYIPINAIIISAIFVFVFIFIIMKYSMNKINKQNIIETIRNENI